MRDIRITQIISDKSSDSFNRYLSDIARYRLVSAEEEADLARRIKSGDSVAENRLISANLRFVVSCAKKYQNMGLPLQDLINEGNMGLIRAAKSFDETKGFKFISYAVWWIRQAMISALSELTRIVRVPMSQQLGMTGIRQQREKLEQLYEREPSYEELADVLEKTVRQIADFEVANAHVKYLDDHLPGMGDDAHTLLDYIPHEDGNLFQNAEREQSASDAVSRILDQLGQRERKIIGMTFGVEGYLQMGQEDIAERLGLSKERVRQLTVASLKTLKERIPENLFREMI